MRSDTREGGLVYTTDRWSNYQWQRFCESTPRSTAVLERGAAKVFSFPRFAREVFHRLFADHAVAGGSPRPENAWAAKAHDALGQLPDFERLHRRCRGDRLLSGTAALTFAEQLLENLPSPEQKLVDPQLLRDEVKGLLAFARRAQGKAEQEEAMQLADAARVEGRAAVQAATAYADALEDSELRSALRSAARAAHGAVDETTASLAAFTGWGSGSGSLDTTPTDVKAQLAACIAGNDKLKALAREAGRLRRIAAAKQRSKADHARHEVTDIERGNDLARLLPSELVKLTDPVMFGELARGLFEGSLLQYRLSGKEPQGRGPIVVCLDQSGSMEGAKEVWSKAVALALLQVASMQRRRCRVIHFNENVARQDDWSPGKVDPLRLVESMAAFYGGGTSFEPPLRSALEAIRNEPHLDEADVIVVTDGEGRVSDSFADEWRAARKRHQVTCYAVHVDSPAGVAPKQLATVADKIIPLADLADDEAAADALLCI